MKHISIFRELLLKLKGESNRTISKQYSYLHGLGLARTRGPVRVSSQPECHRLSESEEALVRQRSVNKFGRVALKSR